MFPKSQENAYNLVVVDTTKPPKSGSKHVTLKDYYKAGLPGYEHFINGVIPVPLFLDNQDTGL